jgi:hypothetical protein
MAPKPPAKLATEIPQGYNLVPAHVSKLPGGYTDDLDGRGQIELIYCDASGHSEVKH